MMLSPAARALIELLAREVADELLQEPKPVDTPPALPAQREVAKLEARP